jgi:hypothetical protein
VSWIYVEDNQEPELSEDEVVDLLNDLAARSAATAADLRRLGGASDDTLEVAEAWARRRGITLMQRTYTSSEARRLGPGFSFEMPGMALSVAFDDAPSPDRRPSA